MKTLITFLFPDDPFEGGTVRFALRLLIVELLGIGLPALLFFAAIWSHP